jgi:hypothetical protein
MTSFVQCYKRENAIRERTGSEEEMDAGGTPAKLSCTEVGARGFSREDSVREWERWDLTED